MRLNHLGMLAVSVTSPRRGEVGSRLRDPGEGDPPSELICSPSPGMGAQGAPIPTSPHPNSGLPEFGTLKWPKSDISDLGWGEGKKGCVNLIGTRARRDLK